MARAAIGAQRQAGGAVAKPEAFHLGNFAEVGVDERDGAAKASTSLPVPPLTRAEGCVGDGEHVVARAADQYVGAAVAEQHVVARPPTMSSAAALPVSVCTPAPPAW